MAKQYIFNITVNEQDAVQGTNVKQKCNIANSDLSLLATTMSSENMRNFAERHLDITQNQYGYNYALLKYWNKKAGDNAKQVSQNYRFFFFVKLRSLKNFLIDIAFHF